ncbi:MAG TPA: hypothetical protein VMM78_19755, partial [Thermomicrobiales bacterium]|nr:hypothetical protein [Thermomicrobiales bacterium]
MTHDNRLTTTYADLLSDERDPAFAQIIADLDILAATGEPPTHVDAAIAQALRHRSHHAITANGATIAAPLSTQHPALSTSPASRIPRPASRRRQFLEIAAACLAFALVALALVAIFRPMSDDGSDEPAAVGGAGEPPSGQIAFVKRTADSSDIYVVNPDGSDERQLTDAPGFDDDPQWSPDGQSIAFASNRNGNYDIYVMDADGSNQRNITNSPDREMYPRWSPDGQFVAFARFTELGNGSLVVTHADGSNPRVVAVAISGRGGISSIAWSPEGSRIAYTQVTHRTSTLFVVDVDGTGRTELSDIGTNGFVMNDTDPQWLPDGQSLLVIRSSFHGVAAMPIGAEDRFHGIVLIETDGTGQRVLASEPEFVPVSFALSPEGSRIAVASPVRSADETLPVELYVMDIDGSDASRLEIPDATTIMPAWSPDGRWLALTEQ